MSQSLPRIWIITDPTHRDGPLVPLRRALDGCPAGVIGVQLRAKEAADRQLVEWGHQLRSLTAATGHLLTINRRPDVAQIVAADGVHLPEHAISPIDVRQRWPELRLVGVSRHGREGLRTAERDGASYAFLSPIFEVPGKAAPIGIAGFGTAIAGVGIPTYGLGGVRAEHVPALLEAGAFGVAIRRAIYAVRQPERALQSFVHALDKTLASCE